MDRIGYTSLRYVCLGHTSQFTMAHLKLDTHPVLTYTHTLDTLDTHLFRNNFRG